MTERLYTLDDQRLPPQPIAMHEEATDALESGQVIYCPQLSFVVQPEEQGLLSPLILHPKHKNISYDSQRQRLAGLNHTPEAIALSNHIAPSFMHRYATYAKSLIDAILPQYADALQWGRTSYRPAEIKGRVTSKRKDDTRLHVDAFPATPVQGLRILRVFCNINPNGDPRVWHLGEPFTQVLQQFGSRIPRYSRTRASLLRLIKATKTHRTEYDHKMLHLHDGMKLDDDYQNNITKHRVDFPPNSSWIVFTDHVSHAALSGQYLLEQTFYLPVSAMRHPEHAPASYLNKDRGLSKVPILRSSRQRP